MRETIRYNIKVPYSLHDMNVITFEMKGDDLTTSTQSGMVKATRPYRQDYDLPEEYREHPQYNF